MTAPVLQPGKPLTPTTWAQMTALLPRAYKKPSVTSRALTTTPADDDYLFGIALGVGSYVISVFGAWNLSTTATQKFMTQWGFTGSWSPEVRICYGPAQNNTADRQNATEVQVGAFTVGQNATYDVAVSTGWTSFREEAFVAVTAAGNFSFKWSQAASSSNTTNLQPGTTVLVQPVLT